MSKEAMKLALEALYEYVEQRGQTHLAKRAMPELRKALAKQEQGEPDWSESKTPSNSVWKSQYAPMAERLLQADGAVRFRDEHIEHLRMKLTEKREQDEPVARLKLMMEESAFEGREAVGRAAA